MTTLQKSRVVTLVLGLVLLLAATSYGDIIATHSGKTDPATEPGLAVLSGNGALGTPVSLDLGTTDAWSINDADTGIGHTFTAGELANADTYGYSMSVNVRITAANSPTGQNRFFARANDQRFVAWWSTDSNSIPTISVHPETSRTYTLDSAGYHEYKLLVDANGLADLYVDNIERIANISPDPDAGSNYAAFAGSSAHWNSFVLTVVPEPGAFVLLATGFVGLLAYGWRRRR
jgi:hypothetical protein